MLSGSALSRSPSRAPSSGVRATPPTHNLRRKAVCAADTGDQRPAQEHDESVWALPNAADENDWRDFRAQLVARSRQQASSTTSDPTTVPSQAASTSPSTWAHLLPGPEQGCVLVANPLLFTNTQSYFNKSVILILEQTQQGSMGIILNKPSDLRLEDVQGVRLGSEFSVFAQNRVFLGGDVDAKGLYLLHSHNVNEAVEVRPGVYLGGAEALCEHVREGHAAADSVKWFCRYAGWAPGQLESECERQVWYPVSCSADLLIKPVEGDGRSLWHSVMELVSDDFRRVSQQIRADVL